MTTPDPRTMEPLDQQPRYETATDIRLEMDATRRRMSDAVAELDDRLHGSVDAVRRPVVGARDQAVGMAKIVQDDVSRFVRESPLVAALVAVGVGLALGTTGADRAAAQGAAAGARGAGRAAGGAARGARETAQRKLAERREQRAAEAAAEQASGGLGPADERPRQPGAVSRIARRLGRRVEDQLAEAIEAMRASASKLTDNVVAERAATLSEDEARRQALAESSATTRSPGQVGA